MKLRNTILSVILLAVVSGCSKKYSGDTGLVLLSGITAVNGTITENIGFKYDDNYHLVEYTDDYTNSDKKFKYDGADRLIQVDTYDTKTGYAQTVTYDYSTAGQVNMTGSYKSTPTSAAVNITSTLTLNAAKQVTKATATNGTDYSLYTYDALGNLLTEAAYISTISTTSPANTITYKYDNQKNPLTNTRGNMLNAFKQIMVNNVVNLTASDLSRINGTINYTAYYYVFDATGFPSTATQVSTSNINTTSTTATATYTYIRK